jgi:hypothetical protein
MRGPFAKPTIYQSGTYAPDNNSRWIASIAMDKQGNIGLGYTMSGTQVAPAIYFTGRRATGQKKGSLERETLIVRGSSQTCLLPNGKCAPECSYRDDNGDAGCYQGGAERRWGDYSNLSIDPSDDCTMWYTTEYLKTTGGFNWSTRIARFKFKTCR